MSVADPVQHARLVEGIKPFLYALRNTPYGKRIQNRILKDTQAEQKRGIGMHDHDGGKRKLCAFFFLNLFLSSTGMHKYHHK